MTEPSGEAPTPPPRRRRPGLAFAAGYVLGLLGLPLVLGGATYLYLVADAKLSKPATTATVFVSSGAELSRARATSIVWRRSDEVLRQTCRDACDDIAFRHGRPRVAELEGAPEAASRVRLRETKEPVR
jgi:hypothetical protein